MRHTKVYNIAGWRYKPASALLEKPGESRTLTPQLNRLLLALLEAEDFTLGRDDLVRQVWNRSVVTDDAVARAVSELRKALRSDGNEDPVVTLHGFGYRLRSTANRPGKRAKLVSSLALALLVAVAAVVYWKSQPARKPLIQRSVAPQSVFSNLPPEKQYFPVAERLVYLEQDDGQSRLLVDSNGQAQTLAVLGRHQQLELSPDGKRAAWFSLEGACDLVSTSGGAAPYRTLGSCLEASSRVLSWAPDGSLLFAQLGGTQVTIQVFSNDNREIMTIAAAGCKQLRDIARRSDGRTYLACATDHGDSIYEVGEDRLTQRLNYRSIERFVVDDSDNFYLLSAPHWKPGFTRFAPPDQFEFFYTGRVVDLAFTGNQLILLRNFTNTDLAVVEPIDPDGDQDFRWVAQGSDWIQAIAIDQDNALWQIDDRSGDLALYRDNQPLAHFRPGMLAIPFEQVQCIHANPQSGTIEFIGKDEDGFALARHDTATGALLKHARQDQDAGCASSNPGAAVVDAIPSGYTLFQHVAGNGGARHFLLLERDSYVDIATLDIPPGH